MCVCVCVRVCVCVCWRDAPFTPETACQTLTEQKKEQTHSSVKGDNRGIAPEQEVTDSILTSHLAASLTFWSCSNSCYLSNQHLFFFFFS